MKIVEKAKEIEEKNEFSVKLPECEIGDVVTLSDIWDGEGEAPEESYSYQVADSGEDGTGNEDIWINYDFEVIKEDPDPLNRKIKIKGISLI